MPPNLGGFFMVRSYYTSECHADYFDFERMEALKPDVEARGISTLSQSPMLGFYKQMDNRIKLLEEILSFRMQVFFSSRSRHTGFDGDWSSDVCSSDLHGRALEVPAGTAGPPRRRPRRLARPRALPQREVVRGPLALGRGLALLHLLGVLPRQRAVGGGDRKSVG